MGKLNPAVEVIQATGEIIFTSSKNFRRISLSSCSNKDDLGQIHPVKLIQFNFPAVRRFPIPEPAARLQMHRF